MLNGNIIEESVSPQFSPIIMVPTLGRANHLCTNYRNLNRNIIKDSFPLPKTDQVLDSFYGAKLFSTLYLLKGYWQIQMAK